MKPNTLRRFAEHLHAHKATSGYFIEAVDGGYARGFTTAEYESVWNDLRLRKKAYPDELYTVEHVVLGPLGTSLSLTLDYTRIENAARLAYHRPADDDGVLSTLQHAYAKLHAHATHEHLATAVEDGMTRLATGLLEAVYLVVNERDDCVYLTTSIPSFIQYNRRLRVTSRIPLDEKVPHVASYKLHATGIETMPFPYVLAKS